MIPIENANEVYNAEIKTLWTMFKVLMEQEDDEGEKLKERYKKEFEKIRDGIKIKVYISYLIEEWYDVYPSSGKAHVKNLDGKGKTIKIDLSEFMDEINERETLMRKIILENMEDDGITSPRS